MVEKNKIIICDKCERVIADNICPICKSDICRECTKEKGVGTIHLNLCNDCHLRLSRIGIDRGRGFWREFNDNEDMVKKIIEYLNKNLILDKLDDIEYDEITETNNGM